MRPRSFTTDMVTCDACSKLWNGFCLYMAAIQPTHSVVPKHSAQFNRRKAFSSLRQLQHQTRKFNDFRFTSSKILPLRSCPWSLFATNRGRHTAALAFFMLGGHFSAGTRRRIALSNDQSKMLTENIRVPIDQPSDVVSILGCQSSDSSLLVDDTTEPTAFFGFTQ
jgi:hypothetical protein